MRNSILLLLILLLTFSSFNSVNAATITGSTSNIKQTSDSPITKLDKANAYIDLNNYIINDYYKKVLKRYFIYFGTKDFYIPESEPDVVQVIQYDLDIIDKSLYYSTKGPYMEHLDEAVQDLVPKLKTLISVTNEAHAYYNQKDYIDDNYAKGKEYHDQIISSFFDEVMPSLDTFFEQIHILCEEQRKADLQYFVDNDYMLQYSMLDILIQAQEIQNEIKSQNISSVNVLSLNVSPVKEKYEKLILSIDNLKKYSEQSYRYEKEGIMKIQVEQYLEEAGLTKATITEMMQRVKDKEPVDEFDIKYGYTYSDSGTPENLVYQISSLIDYYNTVISNPYNN